MIRIFVSSVQREFAGERIALRDHVRNNPALRRFFEVFLFEDAPASDRRPDELYLAEVERCDIYVGLFGDEYGSEDEEGLSPTEREFMHATTLGKHRLVFLRNAGEGARHPKMEALIGRAQAEVIRKNFTGPEELVAAFYEALIEYMEENDLLRTGPFDAAPCLDAGMDDLDPERMRRFVRTARAERQFPLNEKIPAEELLEHLDLLHKGRPTHAAVLLFGRRPQRFLLTSLVKCAHFHGTQVAKPIPSLQMYEGTVFEMVDDAVDFVLSKIALSVGTRAESAQVPVAYEIPKEVVREAIVNAVAHRDYASNGSVQVMLFADRLEVWNPGSLPWPLTLEKLRRAHESVPGNRLLARAMYFVKYIEEMGTGTVDMIERCVSAGLPEPEFESTGTFVTRIRRAAMAGRPVVFTERTRLKGDASGAANGQGGTQRARDGGQVEVQAGGQAGVQAGGQAGGQVEEQAAPEARDVAMLQACAQAPATGRELRSAARYSARTKNFELRLERLLKRGLLEMTHPDKPRSPLQRYRLTARGRAVLTSATTTTNEA